MSEMQHPTADRLEAYVEGLLATPDRVVLESHLVGCGRCQQAVDEWLALFAALSDLPGLEPAPGFADRVMAHVRISPRQAWREQTARAGEMLARVLPKTTFGWALATAFLALPVLIGGGAFAWLLSKSYVTPQALWAFLSSQLLEAARAVGAGTLSAVIQTDVAAWGIERGAAFFDAVGMTGVGALAAAAGLTLILSIWVLYRNLFRTPSRETNYVLYSL